MRILISEGPISIPKAPTGASKGTHVSGPGPHPQMEKLESLTLVKLARIPLLQPSSPAKRRCRDARGKAEPDSSESFHRTEQEKDLPESLVAASPPGKPPHTPQKGNKLPSIPFRPARITARQPTSSITCSVVTVLVFRHLKLWGRVQGLLRVLQTGSQIFYALTWWSSSYYVSQKEGFKRSSCVNSENSSERFGAAS